MAEQEQRIGIVVRADGTVPFDDDCHPQVRAAVFEHLRQLGIPLHMDEHGVHRIPDHTKHVHKLNGQAVVPD